MSGLPAYLGYRAFAALFSRLPEPAMRHIGTAMGTAAFYIARGRRAMAERHMRRVLGPDADVRAAARKMFASYGRYWAEVFWVTPDRRESFAAGAVVVEGGLDRVYEARAEGNGVILALPHVGNWEAAGAFAAEHDLGVLAVAEALPNERIVEWFISIRNALGIDVVIARKGSNTTRALLERLGRGGIVALLCDRDLSGRGIPVRFFGEETTLPAGPAALAERTGAVLLPVGCFFAEGPGHRFRVADRVPVADGATREERVAATAQRLAATLEDMIRHDPSHGHRPARKPGRLYEHDRVGLGHRAAGSGRRLCPQTS